MKIPQIEISIAYKGAKKTDLKQISCSQDCADVMRQLFNADTINWTEEFIMVCLNNANKVIGYYKVSQGGCTQTIADIKVIATIALQTAANQILVAHNHPSGKLVPSNSDREETKRLKEGLRILDIKLLDHLIMSDEGYYSFADEGQL